MSRSRPVAPFNRRRVEIEAAEWVGSYRVITVRDHEAPFALPGQFHMLAPPNGGSGGEEGRPWLPRAISFLKCDGEGGFSFLIDPVGPGTRSLCALEAGDGLLVAGPFGNGFDDPEADRLQILVGGGIGAAPILAQADRLESLDVGHDLLLGFRSSEHAQVAASFERAVVCTDDGSSGRAGTVVDALLGLLGAGDRREILACGPPAMLEATRLAARAASVPCSFALEAPMACGFGACFGCAIETVEGTIRLCVDGPVVRGELLEGITETGRRPG